MTTLKRTVQVSLCVGLVYGGLLWAGGEANATNTRILESNPGSAYVLDTESQRGKPLTRAGLATSVLRLADKAEAGGFQAEARELNKLAGKILASEESGK